MIQLIKDRFTGETLHSVEADSLKEAIVKLVEEKKSLADANLAGANLAGAYLAGAYLTGANLADAYLAGANLTRANLTRANLAGANLADANLTGAYLAGANLAGALGFRFADAPDPLQLRKAVADHIEAHPELHDQKEWGEGEANPACGTPCCVAGWACRLGGGRRDQEVSSAAFRLLWVDGLPMPSFSAGAERADILAALRAQP